MLGSQGHRGERLVNLVVQLARDPQSLVLLSGDDAGGALAPLSRAARASR
jgi:hypothetical protein